MVSTKFVQQLSFDYILAELVWKVARYTSAAPVFFAECDNYVDGGVKANNPTTFGLAEIQDFLAKKYGSVAMILLNMYN